MSNGTATATALANHTAKQIAAHVSTVTLLREAPQFVAGPDGSVNVYLSVLDGLETIAAHVNPQGEMTDLQSVIRNTKDETVSTTNMKKSGLWTTLKMKEVYSN